MPNEEEIQTISQRLGTLIPGADVSNVQALEESVAQPVPVPQLPAAPQPSSVGGAVAGPQVPVEQSFINDPKTIAAAIFGLAALNSGADNMAGAFLEGLGAVGSAYDAMQAREQAEGKLQLQRDTLEQRREAEAAQQGFAERRLSAEETRAAEDRKSRERMTLAGFNVDVINATLRRRAAEKAGRTQSQAADKALRKQLVNDMARSWEQDKFNDPNLDIREWYRDRMMLIKEMHPGLTTDWKIPEVPKAQEVVKGEDEPGFFARLFGSDAPGPKKAEAKTEGIVGPGIGELAEPSMPDLSGLEGTDLVKAINKISAGGQFLYNGKVQNR